MSDILTIRIMKSKLSIPQRSSIVRSRNKSPKRTLKTRVILFGLCCIAIVSLVLLVLPYLPRLRFLIQRPRIDATSYQAAAQATKNGRPSSPEVAKPGNRLILPSIGVDAQVIDGSNIYVIGKNQGVWRETGTIDPSENGNIVIAGHRFLYTATNGGWFYSLPELKNGQKIYIRWQDKTYEYEVYNSKTVLPSEVDIRDNDPNVPKKLTMYTCYPLGSTAKRFVIEAKQL